MMQWFWIIHKLSISDMTILFSTALELEALLELKIRMIALESQKAFFLFVFIFIYSLEATFLNIFVILSAAHT